MANKLKRIAENIKTAVLASPAEVLLSFGFCVVSILYHKERTLPVEGMLTYFPVFFLITNMLNHLTAGTNKRILYYLSLFICLPFIGLDNLFSSPTYLVSLVVVQLVYFISMRKSDNNDFMNEALSYLITLGSALFLALVTWVLSVSIYFSIQYIFEIWDSNDRFALATIASFSFIFILPVLFLVLYNKRSILIKVDKLFDVLFNYVLTPALLIYAIILYLYFVKIVVTWSLPKGKVAFIVVSFVVVFFVLRGFQTFLSRRFYGWFYQYASIISLPVLIMYWVGTCYRINQYGFTELRVYLVVIGLLLTLMAALFLSQKYGRYLYIASAIALLLSVVTYIPGINAKSIQKYSQQGRIERGEVDKFNEWTNYTNLGIDIESTKSITIEGYKEITLLKSQKEDGAMWFDYPDYGEKGDTFYVYNANDRLLCKESAQVFFDNQLKKNGVALGDSIPQSIYTELLKFETDSGMLIFTHISLSRDAIDAPYKINYLNPGYYLSK